MTEWPLFCHFFRICDARKEMSASIDIVDGGCPTRPPAGGPGCTLLAAAEFVLPAVAPPDVELDAEAAATRGC